MKKCSACSKIKELEDFHKDKNDKSGYRGKCKICVRENVPAPRLGFVKEYVLTGELIVCRACGEDKDRCYYSFNHQRGKYHAKCNLCSRKGIPLIVKIDPTEKICKSCNITKPVEDFYKTSHGGLFTSCKICSLNVRKAYSRGYYQNNKDKVKEYNRKRRLSNLPYRLTGNIRSSIIRSLCSKNYSKNKRTHKILGCSIQEFKAHIESQFLSWMSWNNYGNVCETLEYNCSWDLDHIVPVACAKTEEEIYLLNHWSNFQPLCSKVNREIKRDNVVPLTNLELKVTKYENTKD